MVETGPINPIVLLNNLPSKVSASEQEPTLHMSSNLNMYFLYMYFLYQGHHDDREAFAVVVEASFKSKRNPS